MSINLNTTNIKNVKFNNTDLTAVYFNNTLVWKKDVSALLCIARGSNFTYDNRSQTTANDVAISVERISSSEGGRLGTLITQDVVYVGDVLTISVKHAEYTKAAFNNLKLYIHDVLQSLSAQNTITITVDESMFETYVNADNEPIPFIDIYATHDLITNSTGFSFFTISKQGEFSKNMHLMFGYGLSKPINGARKVRIHVTAKGTYYSGSTVIEDLIDKSLDASGSNDYIIYQEVVSKSTAIPTDEDLTEITVQILNDDTVLFSKTYAWSRLPSTYITPDQQTAVTTLNSFWKVITCGVNKVFTESDASLTYCIRMLSGLEYTENVYLTHRVRVSDFLTFYVADVQDSKHYLCALNIRYLFDSYSGGYDGLLLCIDDPQTHVGTYVTAAQKMLRLNKAQVNVIFIMPFDDYNSYSPNDKIRQISGDRNQSTIQIRDDVDYDPTTFEMIRSSRHWMDYLYFGTTQDCKGLFKIIPNIHTCFLGIRVSGRLEQEPLTCTRCIVEHIDHVDR